MKPIRLRAHHAKIFQFCLEHDCSAEPSEEFYGEGFNDKVAAIFIEIREDKTPIEVIGDYDDICEICKAVKTEEGCFDGKRLHTKEKVYEADMEIALTLKLEIGRTYQGKDFLNKLGKGAYQ